MQFNPDQYFTLSICVPTYNRAELLVACLRSILGQIANSDAVEVVVSDNCSTDNTESVIQEFKHYTNFRYSRQIENIGMSRNIMSSVDLARGKFCWIIGDDDFIVQGAISKLVKLILDHKHTDFFYAKLEGFPLKEYEIHSGVFDTSLCPQFNVNSDLQYEEMETWEDLLVPKYSVAYMGELMAGIFKKSIWDSVKFSPDGDFLSNLDTSYPHCVIYANSFIGKKAIYIRTPLILALEGKREWIDRLGYIAIVILKDLIDLYKEKGVNNKILRICYVEYIRRSLRFALFYIFKRSSYKDKVSLTKYFKFLFFNPFLTVEAIYINLKYFLKKILREAFPKTFLKVRKIFLNPESKMVQN